MANDVAAIHVMKTQLRLSEDDYRALLRNLTGKASCSELAPSQLQAVRRHFDGLVRTAKGEAPRPRARLSQAEFERKKQQTPPMERKILAMWNQLARDGRIQNGSTQALDAWVARQVGVSALRFCTPAQLHTLIESLKHWHDRSDA